MSKNLRSTPLRRFLANKLSLISALVLCCIIVLCMLAPVIAPYDHNEIHMDNRNQPSSPEHLLGTDNLGRDTFSRMLFGGRNTIQIAFMALLVGAAGGTVIGVISGFCGGYVDGVIMRIIDGVSAIPTVLLVIAMEYALGWGQGKYMYAIGIALLPPFTKVIRSSVLRIMGSEYIEAARALGVSSFTIVTRHVLRNIATPLLIQLSSAAAEAFIMCTIIGYIGIGITPPEPEWGALASGYSAGRSSSSGPAGLACLAIVLCALALNLLGNGLRDAFDTGRKGVRLETEGGK